MRPKSIRWRLTLSYAAIALLAALALGLVLLTTLRSYYQQHEKVYLADNAEGITTKFAEAIKDGVPLDPQVQGLSFLLQARVRVIGPDKSVLADSGIPNKTGVAVGEGKFTRALSMPDPPGSERLTIIAITTRPGSFTNPLPVPAAISAPLPISDTIPGQFILTNQDVLKSAVTYYAPFKVAGTSFGFEVNSETVDQSGGRSDQIVSQPLYDAAGILRGSVELSDGPAYGQEIVDSVAQAWAIAGAIAVVLAAVTGWILSRRLSKPILALTDVTTRMADGDLSTRARVSSRDEIGTLAGSFNDMADRIEETIMTLRRFVADAAHELHTPLTALQTDLELSADEEDALKRHDLIERAQSQVTRLRALTSSLLDLSRLEANGAQLEQSVVDLVDLVRDIGEPYASQADQAGLNLVLDLPEEPIQLPSNPQQLRRALGNLLDNAIKFTPEGGTVTIHLRRADESIELCVEDTGIGIPEDDLPLLFSRFHRGRNAARYPGNGLGLAIVKAIVEAHKGKVHAENTGHGARFCVAFPQVISTA